MVYNFLVIFFNNEAAWLLRCTGFVHREESLARVKHGLGSPNLLYNLVLIKYNLVLIRGIRINKQSLFKQAFVYVIVSPKSMKHMTKVHHRNSKYNISNTLSC